MNSINQIKVDQLFDKKSDIAIRVFVELGKSALFGNNSINFGTTIVIKTPTTVIVTKIIIEG
jgi:hypothetical protein